MKTFKVTQEWLKEQSACGSATKRFGRHWPKGLTVNRRNLYKATKVLPIGDIMWLAHQLLHPSVYKGVGYKKCCKITKLGWTKNGNEVRGQENKHAFAKALADAVEL